MTARITLKSTAFVLCTATAVVAQDVADAIYSNGKIYTVDEQASWAEAVAIKDGRFIAVGAAEDVLALSGPNMETYDLEGHFVMPGLVDTHTHPFIDAIRQVDQLSIDGASESAEDIRDQIAAYARANPEKEWILGMGWPKGVFPEENPHRDLFDEAVADRPGCLMDQGGHSFWCNSLALEIAGVTADFEPPRGAVIETDEDGTPSGTVRETALGYMKQFVIKPSDAVFLEAAEYFQDLARSNGITATRTATGSEDTHRTLTGMIENDALTMRWAVGLDVNYFESAYTYEERLAQIERRGQSDHHPGEDALVAPTFPAVVESLVRAVFLRRIAPAQTIAINKDYPAQHPPVIDAGFAMRLWEEGLKTRHLGVGQPKQIRHVHRSFFEP